MTTQHDEHESIDSVELDILGEPVIMPAHKLDADQYSADDIDGVTESIFGSGNLAYASLQASQTDAAIALNEAMAQDQDHAPEHDDGGSSGGVPVGFADNVSSFAPQPGAVHVIPTDTDRVLDAGNEIRAENPGTEGHFSGGTVGALGASALSFDAGSFSGGSGLSLNNSTIDDITNGGSTSNSTTVNNETNIVDAGDTVQNIVNTVNETITNITNLGDELVENITNLGDQIIENILEGDITEVTEVLTNQVTEVTEILNTEINNVVETVNNFLEETGITEVTNQVTEITNEITENVTNVVNDVLDDVLGGGITVDLDTGLLDTFGTGLHVAIDDSIAGTIGTGLVSDNLSGLVGGLTGLDVPLLADTGASVSFNLLGGADPNDGADISVAGLELPDIPLDPVEAIVGDIDIAVDLPGELLTDPGALLGSVEDLAGSLDDIALADPADILGILGGQGADGAFGIGLGETQLSDEAGTDVDSLIGDLTEGLDTGSAIGDMAGAENGDLLDGLLSDVEELIGNIAEGLDTDEALGDIAGLDDIGDAADIGGVLGILGDGDAGESEPVWTESTIDAGGMFGDLAAGLAGGDALPDPVGTVAEGIGALDVVPELDIGSLGGLFG